MLQSVLYGDIEILSSRAKHNETLICSLSPQHSACCPTQRFVRTLGRMLASKDGQVNYLGWLESALIIPCKGSFGFIVTNNVSL